MVIQEESATLTNLLGQRSKLKRISGLSKLRTQTKPEARVTSAERDESVEEYMQTAARMIYDIILEWRERHRVEGNKSDSPIHLDRMITDNSNNSDRRAR